MMNVLDPVSSIMTTNLVTVNAKDKLLEVKKIFDNHKIHHVPVVDFRKIIGIISKTDLLSFLKGASGDSYEKFLNESRLRNYYAEEIMTTGIAKLNSTDRIAIALEVFKENLFHAIPVVDNDELVGIVTTYDIIKTLADEPVNN